MGAIGRRIEPNRPYPAPRRRHTARKEELVRLQMRRRNPSGDRVPRLFGDLELHWPLRLLLHDNCARGDVTALDHIMDAKRDQIAPAQLAVDGEVEQRKFSGSMIRMAQISFSFSGGF